jgi:hypothetical protein
MLGRLLKLLIIVLFWGAGLNYAYGQQNDLQDANTVKALFVYNFTKYIEWPNLKPGAPFIIQVYGDAEMKEGLDKMLKGRKVQDHPIEVRQYSLADTTPVQINYIPARQYNKAQATLKNTEGNGSLEITDGLTGKNIPGINLIKIDEKLKFQLNEQAIRKEGLKISIQLLDLAVSEED